MRQLPHMNELHEKYASKGLHIFTLYGQSHPLKQIEELVAKQEIAYPIALEGIWAESYPSPGLPRTWLIGADGKIAFIGPSAKDDLIEKELAKVKYPGLGKAEVAKEVEAAAAAFGEGKFAQAVKLATSVVDGDHAENVIKNAEYVLERVEARIRALNQRAEVAETLKDIPTALAAWNELATRYAGCEDAAEAPARLKKLKEDKDAQKELAARKAWVTNSRQLEWDARELDFEDSTVLKGYWQKCVTEFQKFAKENADTAAARHALSVADKYQAAIKAAEKPAEKTPEKAPEKAPEK